MTLLSDIEQRSAVAIITPYLGSHSGEWAVVIAVVEQSDLHRSHDSATVPFEVIYKTIKNIVE